MTRMNYIRGEEGAALAIALMVLVICSLLGATAILVSRTDMQIASNLKYSRRAFYNADACIQWLRPQNLGAMTMDQDIEQTVGNVTFTYRIINNPRMEGSATVYPVRCTGRDGPATVVIDADIRVAPPGGGPAEEFGYAGAG
jgi:hypothetical protein